MTAVEAIRQAAQALANETTPTRAAMAGLAAACEWAHVSGAVPRFMHVDGDPGLFQAAYRELVDAATDVCGTLKTPVILT